ELIELSNHSIIYDEFTQASGAALSLSARHLCHGSDGTDWRADFPEPRRRTKTGGEESGNDNIKRIAARITRVDNKTFQRRIEAEADPGAILRHTEMWHRASVQQRLLEQSRARDLR